MDTTVLIPVKPLHLAKSRLRRDLSSGVEELVLAMACDVVQAAVDSSAVTRVVVVSDDSEVGRRCRVLGAHLLPDSPAAALNALLAGVGAAMQREHGGLLLCQPADCPAVIAEDFLLLVEACLSAAGPVFVADASGVGTTALAVPAGATVLPRYGHDSRAAHLAGGYRELRGPLWHRLAQDVDRLGDLQAAQALGVGPHTGQWLGEHLGATTGP